MFNTDNNQKCFLAVNQYIIMISEDHVTLEDWSNDAENTDLITAINNIVLCIQVENSSLKLYKYFTIVIFLLYFSSNKCSLNE